MIGFDCDGCDGRLLVDLQLCMGESCRRDTGRRERDLREFWTQWVYSSSFVRRSYCRRRKASLNA